MSKKLFLVAEKYEIKLKKEAGLVKVPNEIVDKLYQFTKSFFHRCLYEMYLKFIKTNKSLTKSDRLDLRLIFEKFQKDVAAEQSNNFEISSQNFKHKILYDDTYENKYQLDNFKIMHGFSVVALGFGENPEMNINSTGEFSPRFIVRNNIMSFGHINVNITDYLNNIWLYLTNGFFEEIDNLIKYSYQEIRSTIEHELIHLFQSINFKADIEFGLPTKKILTPEFIQGDIEVKKNFSKNHYLDDLEFYTNLSDSVKRYKDNIKKFPLSLHEDVLKYSIYNGFKKTIQSKYLNILIAEANNLDKKLYKIKDIKNTVLSKLDYMLSYFNTIRDNFKILYQNSPAKYQKAVKEFYKAVKEN